MEVPYVCCTFLINPTEIGKDYPPPLARELVVKYYQYTLWYDYDVVVMFLKNSLPVGDED